MNNVTNNRNDIIYYTLIMKQNAQNPCDDKKKKQKQNS